MYILLGRWEHSVSPLRNLVFYLLSCPSDAGRQDGAGPLHTDATDDDPYTDGNAPQIYEPKMPDRVPPTSDECLGQKVGRDVKS